jgi:gamma-glutamyltranspeptidase/glutathione hydrolase
VLAIVALILPHPALAQVATPAPPPTVYARGAVAADHVVASRAGLDMLERGGNAVDAAVAASFCLSVVRPFSCGIGGGGFMLIHLPDDPSRGRVTIALDYRERAPHAVGPDHFEALPDDASRASGHAVAVPGTVAGLLVALEQFGTLDRRTVLAPAIRAAEEGFVVDASLLKAIETLRGHLDGRGDDRERFAAGDAFLRRRLLHEAASLVGRRVRLPEQAHALRLIAERGRSAFYQGPIGEAVVQTVRAAGGVMTMDDLGRYRVTSSQPLQRDALGHRFLAMPLPSSGGLTQLQILDFLERHAAELGAATHNDDRYVHLVTEAMKYAFADRAAWLGDPEFVEVPVSRLLDPQYLRGRAERYDPLRTQPPGAYGGGPGLPTDGGTSHVSVVDRFGGAVACTETINLVFGARIAVADYGFLLNNEMDDFLTRRGQPNAFGLQQSERNLPAPGKRPLSSMSPTIVLDARGDVHVVAGASGGPRIISATTQVILNVVLDDMHAIEAVRAPRFHHQWAPDILYLEQGLTAPRPTPDGQGGAARIDALEARGHELGTREDIGTVQLIRRVRNGWEAASDPRKGGRAAGY